MDFSTLTDQELALVTQVLSEVGITYNAQANAQRLIVEAAHETSRRLMAAWLKASEKPQAEGGEDAI